MAGNSFLVIGAKMCSHAELSVTITDHLLTVRISHYVSSLKLFDNQIAVTLKPYYRICLSFIEQDKL